MPNDEEAIVILLLYGDLTEYGDGSIAFNVPGYNNWHRSYASSILHIVKVRMEDAVLCIESER